MTPANLVLFLRLSRPLFLVGTVFFYFLGGGIAHYLGVVIDIPVFILGQLWVSLLQLSAQYLNEYFDSHADQNNANRTFLTGGSGALGPGKLPRRVALMAAYTTLALLAYFSVLLITRGNLVPSAFLVMILAFLAAIFYSTPPVRFAGSGYGELIISVLISFLVPAFAFILQTGEWHRLVLMSALPLTVVLLAMLIALELPDYANDLKFEKRTLIVRLGWQNAMTLHNMLILIAFFLLALARFYGYPWFATLSGIAGLAIGFIQIWQMRRIERGEKPNWNLLTIGAVAHLSVTVYLITFSFWTH